jgi:hypothetical protein
MGFQPMIAFEIQNHGQDGRAMKLTLVGKPPAPPLRFEAF